jgi:hypothetical protein
MSTMNSMFSKAVEEIINFISNSRNERFVNSIYNDDVLGDSFGDVITTIFEISETLREGRPIHEEIQKYEDKKRLGHAINLILKVIKGSEPKTAILETIKKNSQQQYINLREVSISTFIQAFPDNDYTPEEVLSLLQKVNLCNEEEYEEQDSQEHNDKEISIEKEISYNKQQYLELFYPFFELHRDGYIDINSLVYICVHVHFFFMNRAEHIDRDLWPKVIRELSDAVARKIKYLYYKSLTAYLSIEDTEDKARQMAFNVIRQTLSENNSYGRTQYRSNWANIRVVVATICRKYMKNPNAYISVKSRLDGKNRNDYKKDSRMKEFIQSVFEEFMATSKNDYKGLFE